MEKCPLCYKNFPLAFLERHVNTCLDTLESVPEPQETKHSPGKSASPEEHPRQKPNAFAALGLKADSRRSSDKPSKKESATLTSILIAERQLKRKQEQLEKEINSEEAGLSNHESPDIKDDLPDSKRMCMTQVPSVKEELPSLTQPLRADNKREVKDTKREEIASLRKEAELPLAQRLRPKSLDDFFGQEKLVGTDGLLRNMIHSPNLPSFILWGVPGVGKTSLARIVARSSNYKFVEVSGSDGNSKRLKEVFSAAQIDKDERGQKTVLFLDEIHRFNKAVQDLLLPVIEKGVLTVIGATTENPSFSLNNALLSRMHTFVMEPLSTSALVKILNRGLYLINKTRKLVFNLHLIALSKDSIDYIANLSTGDSRVALNILESVNAYLSGLSYKAIAKKEMEKETIEIPARIGVIKIDLDQLKPLLSTRNYHQMYDRVGDNHYDTISAFHKAVRGSDENAAIFYLARMLKGGEDPLFIMRRMIVIASEDVGLRDSTCLPFAISALEAVQFIGMPEGRIVMAHCALKLARAAKSTKSYRALNNAQSLLTENPDAMKTPIPLHLRNAPTKLMKELGYGDTYKYNPNFKHGLIKQEFMPEDFKGAKFVEETHLGEAIDDEVDPAEYEKADQDYQKYQEFKKRKRGQRVRILPQRHSGMPDLAERASSYDENLPMDQQSDYFEGTTEIQDTVDCTNDNFDCSYDELMVHADEKDFPIFFSEQLLSLHGEDKLRQLEKDNREHHLEKDDREHHLDRNESV